MESYLGVLTAVFAVATIVAGAWAGLQRGTTQNLREANGDLRDRANDLEKERDEALVKIVTLKSDLDALARVVTGEAYLTALGIKLDEHHNEARAHWVADLEISRETLAAIRRLSGGTG